MVSLTATSIVSTTLECATKANWNTPVEGNISTTAPSFPKLIRCQFYKATKIYKDAMSFYNTARLERSILRRVIHSTWSRPARISRDNTTHRAYVLPACARSYAADLPPYPSSSPPSLPRLLSLRLHTRYHHTSRPSSPRLKAVSSPSALLYGML